MRAVHRTTVVAHDHSKGVIGRDDGSANSERPADWWPEKPEIPEDAPEVKFRVVLASGASWIDVLSMLLRSC